MQPQADAANSGLRKGQGFCTKISQQVGAGDGSTNFSEWPRCVLAFALERPGCSWSPIPCRLASCFLAPQGGVRFKTNPGAFQDRYKASNLCARNLCAFWRNRRASPVSDVVLLSTVLCSIHTPLALTTWHAPCPHGGPQLKFWVYVGVTGWEGTAAKVPDIWVRIGGDKVRGGMGLC